MYCYLLAIMEFLPLRVTLFVYYFERVDIYYIYIMVSDKQMCVLHNMYTYWPVRVGVSEHSTLLCVQEEAPYSSSATRFVIKKKELSLFVFN